MELIIQHSGFVLMFGTSMNVLSWWNRGHSTRARFPQRTASYQRMIMWLLLVGNLPWMVLGVGVLSGSYVTPLDPLFLPEKGALEWLFWAAGLSWPFGLMIYVFVFDGAEEMSEHPGLLNLPSAWERHPMT